MTNDSRETILVVDDVPLNIDLLVNILGAHYRVIFATSGHDALALALGPTPPSLILLDVMMPGMDGYEVCSRLKSIESTKETPIIFLSALADAGNEERGLNVGAVDYLSKPFRPAIVLQRVRIHLALHNQKTLLEETVQVRTRELGETRIEIVRRLGRAAEYRDNETGMHVIRMSSSCRLLALAAGLPEDVADLFLLAAPMHDVGKIGVPDHILLKPGKLDEDEWVVMRRHAEIGAEIIGMHESSLLSMARSIALTHHEKWNGSGYPHGLVGDAIPIAGRIAAICDVYDALTSVRPYKKAWTSEEAMALIVKESGVAFDPTLVSLFVELLPEILQIGARYSDSHPQTE